MPSESTLNNSNESEHSCLVSGLRGSTLFFTIECIFAGFVAYGLYYVEVGSLYAHFLEDF